MNWIKKNKLLAFLILVVILLFLKEFLPSLRLARTVSVSREVGLEGAVELGVGGAPSFLPPIPRPEFTPTEQEDRLVVEESMLSLVVSNVRETSDKIVTRAKEAGGFMVSSELSRPEEAPFATVIVRVPAEKLSETLDYFRGLAVKVSSENIKGTDVTDEYVDIEARLETLEKTKAKFEAILNQATRVEDILKVQRELINLQDRIDALKGRQQYLEQTAKLAKVTVYLSTDELALPYVPAKLFRPTVIFKLAFRSLMLSLRSIATLLIWVVVYAVIWVPALAAIIFLRRWWKKRTP